MPVLSLCLHLSNPYSLLLIADVLWLIMVYSSLFIWVLLILIIPHIYYLSISVCWLIWYCGSKLSLVFYTLSELSTLFWLLEVLMKEFTKIEGLQISCNFSSGPMICTGAVCLEAIILGALAIPKRPLMSVLHHFISS